MPNWSGHDYADVSSLQRAVATEAVTALRFGADDRVLDVGCGDGSLTRAVAEMVPDGYAVGVDASPKMIETAHGGGEPTGSGPWFVVAHTRQLPFAEFFDAVLSFNAWVQVELAKSNSALFVPRGLRIDEHRLFVVAVRRRKRQMETAPRSRVRCRRDRAPDRRGT